jgi:WD40 repeat protein
LNDSLLNDLSAFTLTGWVYVTDSGSTPFYREWSNDGTARVIALITSRSALRISTYNERSKEEDKWVTGLVPSGAIAFGRWNFVAIRFDESIPNTPVTVSVNGKHESIRGQKLSFDSAGITVFGGPSSIIRMGALFPRALTNEELDTFYRIGMRDPKKLIAAFARTAEDNTNTPKRLLELKGPRSSINQVSFFPDGQSIAAVSDDPAVWVWELPSGKLKYSVPVEELPREVSVSPNGKLLAISGWGGPTLFDARSGEKLFDMSSNPTSRQSPTRHASVFANDNKSIYFALDSKIQRFDLEKRETLIANQGESAWGSTRRLSLSSDSKYLVGANMGMCVVFDAESLEELVRFPDHQGKVYDVDISFDNQRVVSASADSTLCVWAMKSGQLEKRFIGHSEGVKSAKFTRDGQKIISGSYDGTLRIWDVNTGKELWKVQDIGANHADVSTDGRYFACGGGYVSRTVKTPETESLKVTVFEFTDPPISK